MMPTLRHRSLATALFLSMASATVGQGGGSHPSAKGAVITENELREIVAYLASPALTGRGSCPEHGAVTASAFVAEAFREIGLEPAGAGGYLQPFDCPAGGHADNVVGRLAGTDPALAGESILIGAHHDHLGADASGHYPGADDNASGVAVLLEAAEALAAGPTPLRRPLTFVSFSAEERGRIGSRHHALEHQPALVVNLDMVGHLDTGGLRVYGGSATARLADLVRDVAVAHGIRDLELTPSAGCGSDQEPFVERGVPSLFLHTGVHLRYHSHRDTPGSLDYPGLAVAARAVRDLVLRLANADALPVTSSPPVTCRSDPGSGTAARGAC